MKASSRGPLWWPIEENFTWIVHESMVLCVDTFLVGDTDLQVRSAVSLEEEEVESGDENEDGDSKIDADAKDKQPLKVHGSINL
jgi:hypothetical protein